MTLKLKPKVLEYRSDARRVYTVFFNEGKIALIKVLDEADQSGPTVFRFSDEKDMDSFVEEIGVLKQMIRENNG